MAELIKKKNQKKQFYESVMKRLALSLKIWLTLPLLILSTSTREDTLFVYTAEANSANIKIDGREIAEADWFDLPNLPPMGNNAKKILETLNV